MIYDGKKRERYNEYFAPTPHSKYTRNMYLSILRYSLTPSSKTELSNALDMNKNIERNIERNDA